MNSSTTTKKRMITCGCKEFLSPEKSNAVRQITERCRALSQKQGAHSNIAMNSAGFHYTDNENAACCDTCELEVSGWILDIIKSIYHILSRLVLICLSQKV